MSLIKYLWCKEPYLLCLEIAVITPLLEKPFFQWLFFEWFLWFSCLGFFFFLTGIKLFLMPMSSCKLA